MDVALHRLPDKQKKKKEKEQDALLEASLLYIQKKGFISFLEIIDELIKSREKTKKVEDIIVVSLDEEHGDDGFSLLDVLPGRGYSPEESASRQSTKFAIESFVVRLDPREQEVISRLYGLQGYEEHTLQEVGELFGRTRERIRQIERTALRRIRLWMRREGLGASSL